MSARESIWKAGLGGFLGSAVGGLTNIVLLALDPATHSALNAVGLNAASFMTLGAAGGSAVGLVFASRAPEKKDKDDEEDFRIEELEDLGLSSNDLERVRKGYASHVLAMFKLKRVRAAARTAAELAKNEPDKKSFREWLLYLLESLGEGGDKRPLLDKTGIEQQTPMGEEMQYVMQPIDQNPAGENRPDQPVPPNRVR